MDISLTAFLRCFDWPHTALPFHVGMVLMQFAGLPHIVSSTALLHLVFCGTAGVTTGDSLCVCDHEPLVAVGVFTLANAIHDASCSHFEDDLNGSMWPECPDTRFSEQGDY